MPSLHVGFTGLQMTKRMKKTKLRRVIAIENVSQLLPHMVLFFDRAKYISSSSTTQQQTRK